MNQSIQASHHAVELEAELRAAEVQRYDARHPQPDPPSSTGPPRPRVKVIVGKKTAAAQAPPPVTRTQVPVPTSKPQPKTGTPVELPPGSMIVSAEEPAAIDVALDYWTQHNPLSAHLTQRSRRS
jgi:hypothetical protein